MIFFSSTGKKWNVVTLNLEHRTKRSKICLKVEAARSGRTTNLFQHPKQKLWSGRSVSLHDAQANGRSQHICCSDLPYFIFVQISNFGLFSIFQTEIDIFVKYVLSFVIFVKKMSRRGKIKSTLEWKQSEIWCFGHTVQLYQGGGPPPTDGWPGQDGSSLHPTGGSSNPMTPKGIRRWMDLVNVPTAFISDTLGRLL